MIRLALGFVPLVGILGLEPAAPRTIRYKIETKNEQVVDLTGAGGPKQEVTMNQIALVSVTLTDSAGGRVMHVVIDSVTSDVPAPDMASALAGAKGAWIHGFLDSWGRATMTAASTDANEIVGEFRSMFARFFPVMRPGAKAGDTWTDTATVDTKTPNRAMKTTRVTNFTLGGASTWSGETAVRLDAAGTASAAGTLENPMAGTMELETTSSGTEAFYLGSDGTYLGGESKTTMNGKIRAAVVPDAIPLTSVSTTKVTVLK
ncbi:MAG: hypothetical protein FJ206_02180 [Gemmatimonadetes bacterium]|nr:hypothetical protein [Gemmatimonadota bacterium]